MCDRCNDLDLQIQKYRRFIAQPIDPLTTERLNAAVAEMEAAKAGLHPRE
jgi:hypothetical protein